MTKEMKTETTTKLLYAGVMALWISLPFAMQALVLLAGTDLFFCLINHKKSVWDFGRKDLVALIFCYVVFILTNMAKAQGAPGLLIEATTAIPIFYCIVIGISILKSISDVGLALPPKLLDWLSRIEGLTLAEKQDLDALRDKQQPKSS